MTVVCWVEQLLGPPGCASFPVARLIRSVTSRSVGGSVMDAVHEDPFEVLEPPEPAVVPGCMSICSVGVDEDDE